MVENRHRFVMMDKVKLGHLVQELQVIGCCPVCIIRYLGVTDSAVYKDPIAIRKVVSSITEGVTLDTVDVDTGPRDKVQRPNACVACLGLLTEGTDVEWMSRIASEVAESGVEGVSYCPSLSLPIALQIRAYSIWFHLKKKFGDFLTPINDLKPEGTSLKTCWKWMVTYDLKKRVDPRSEWGTEGNVKVDIGTLYDEDVSECSKMRDYIMKTAKKKTAANAVSRGTVESHLKWVEAKEFAQISDSPPSIPTTSIQIKSVSVSHEPIFVAGRYCKYSRELSQTPWLIDNVRRTETSVEELISCHILPRFKAKETRFSSSGREDVDVRMLGRGRPFCFEVIQPKSTIFSAESMRELQQEINSSTKLISVRDLQMIDKKSVGILKMGEEGKTKVYCATCILPGIEPTPEHLSTLNHYPLPICLQQKTPVRVLHRRSLATRERNILEMKAVAIPENNELFQIFLRTDAGTYVKEFVHGDFGRTLPNVTTILGLEADILSLDVTEVQLDWPPALE